MIIMKKQSLLMSGIILSVCATSSLVYADAKPSTHSWYVGGNIGLSNMDPDVNDTNWETKDKNDVSKGVFIGKDLNRQIGIEAFWKDFGNAGVESTSGAKGEINYKGYGANVIYNAPQKFGSLRPFGKLGIASLKTTDKAAARSKQLNKTTVFAGVGVEYEVTDRLNLRAGYDYFDKDISELNVGLNWSPHYRTHGHTRVEKPKLIPKAKPAPKPKVVYLPKKVYITKPAPKPKVVYVPKKVVVTKQAKPKYQMMRRVLSGGSNFDTGKFNLTYMGENTLSQLVNDINRQRVSVKNISVIGHTDSIGSIRDNQFLSINRATTVANFLASRGIQRSLISTFGRGELQPIADNRTKYGRAKNRRVEIVINGTSTELIRH